MTPLNKEKKDPRVQMDRIVFTRAPTYPLESYNNQNWDSGQAWNSDIKTNEMTVWIS